MDSVIQPLNNRGLIFTMLQTFVPAAAKLMKFSPLLPPKFRLVHIIINGLLFCSTVFGSVNYINQFLKQKSV